MKNFRQRLEKVRTKPDDEKRVTAFSIALAVTLIITAVWIISTVNRASSPPKENIVREESNIAHVLKSGAGWVKNLIKGGKEVYNSED